MDDVEALVYLRQVHSTIFAPVPPPPDDGESETEESLVWHAGELEFSRLRGTVERLPRLEGYAELVTGPDYRDDHFKENFRMRIATFQALENRIGGAIARQGPTGRPTVPVRTQILATLWLLGTPDSYRSVGTTFGLSKSALHRSVMRVVHALASMARTVIVWPQGERLEDAREKFRARYGIPNVIGVVDGTYIPIKLPNKEHALDYRTRKCNYASNLQLMCDPDLCIIDAFAGYPGSTADARVFANCDIYNAAMENLAALFPDDTFIIGDKAYPCLSWCIPPYKNGQGLILTQSHHDMNDLIASVRQIVERCICLLKGRFRRLKFLDMSLEEEIPFFTLASCVLHNLCLQGLDEAEDIENYIQEGRQNGCQEDQQQDGLAAPAEGDGGVELADDDEDDHDNVQVNPNREQIQRQWKIAGREKRDRLRRRLIDNGD